MIYIALMYNVTATSKISINNYVPAGERTEDLLVVSSMLYTELWICDILLKKFKVFKVN